MAESGVRIVGLGPFRLPGEKRRQRAADERADAWLNSLEHEADDEPDDAEHHGRHARIGVLDATLLRRLTDDLSGSGMSIVLVPGTALASTAEPRVFDWIDDDVS